MNRNEIMNNWFDERKFHLDLNNERTLDQQNKFSMEEEKLRLRRKKTSVTFVFVLCFRTQWTLSNEMNEKRTEKTTLNNETHRQWFSDDVCDEEKVQSLISSSRPMTNRTLIESFLHRLRQQMHIAEHQRQQMSNILTKCVSHSILLFIRIQMKTRKRTLRRRHF